MQNHEMHRKTFFLQVNFGEKLMRVNLLNHRMKTSCQKLMRIIANSFFGKIKICVIYPFTNAALFPIPRLQIP